MPFDPYVEKALLDWVTGAAAVTQPTECWISFATASPNESQAFDGNFNSRVSARMGAASTGASAMASNTIAMSLATANAAQTAIGWNLWDRSSGGTRLMYGTSTANIGCKSADNINIAAGNFKITLA